MKHSRKKVQYFDKKSLCNVPLDSAATNALCNNSSSGILLEYPTTTCFQWGHLKNGPYTYTVSEGNGRVF